MKTSFFAALPLLLCGLCSCSSSSDSSASLPLSYEEKYYESTAVEFKLGTSTDEAVTAYEDYYVFSSDGTGSRTYKYDRTSSYSAYHYDYTETFKWEKVSSSSIIVTSWSKDRVYGEDDTSSSRTNVYVSTYQYNVASYCLSSANGTYATYYSASYLNSLNLSYSF